MKCAGCISEEMKEQAITSAPELEKFIQDAVDNARTAVTVINGEALCASHLAKSYFGYAF